MSVSPIPEGYTSLTPFLVIDGAGAATDFYTSVFGATLVERMDGSDGSVAHAELDFGDGRLQLSDPNADYGLEAPPRGESVTHSMVLYCTDVDGGWRVPKPPGHPCVRRCRRSSPATGSGRSWTRSASAGP